MQTDGLKCRFTFQEARVALAVVDGQNNKEIAAELGISVFTVKSHLKEIFDGLGITSRLELAMWGWQNLAALYNRELWANRGIHRRGCQCESSYCSERRRFQQAA